MADGYGPVINRLGANVTQLGEALDLWAETGSLPPEERRRAADVALDASAAMIEELHGVRQRITQEIALADPAFAAEQDRRSTEARAARRAELPW